MINAGGGEKRSPSASVARFSDERGERQKGTLKYQRFQDRGVDRGGQHLYQQGRRTKGRPGNGASSSHYHKMF